ncbi:MAG: LysM peptidoglycan-binding domain-containing protein [Anaerolineae bacterium]|nr:LysM peptidoglycan-binding domain-containing protein [Thermoflexales bacterium]MDW8406400.1 LysM peptidoglycan-binding domain-containing protein [Anaerolineae bacterium]
MRRPNRPNFNRPFATWVVLAAGLVMVIAGAISVALLAPHSSGQPVAFNITPRVTLYATWPPPTDTSPPTLPTPTAEAAVVAPTPTAQSTMYTVVEGDTLWDIAVRFGLSLDTLIAANPNINPDLLSLGMVLNIPAPGAALPTVPTRAPAVGAPSTTASAHVRLDAGGLRLRRSPSAQAEVITKLAPQTSLRVLARTADDFWLQVVTPQGTQGWVMQQYVDLNVPLAQIPVEGNATSEAGASAQAPPAAIPDDPNLSNMTGRVWQIYQAGQAMGNRPNVFSLIGDSNTANTAFFAPFDWGNYTLGRYAYLQDTIDFFRGSFSRERIAARGGFNTTKALDPANAPAGCAAGESPLACEVRLNRPSVAFILLGTGDQHTWQGFEGRYRQIIELLIGQGVIPVCLTKGDDLESTDSQAPYGYINDIIRRLSREYGVPLLDLRQALAALPNRGFEADGFHINKPPDGQSANLTGSYLSYGYNMYNLTALRALDVIRRQVIGR